MTRASAAQIRQWSEDLARNPASLVFLPLAEAHWAEGRADAARRLCLRGLARYPEHVDTHVLLGRLYRAGGETAKAFDEWGIALRLDPQHAAATRELGLVALELGRADLARRHLEQAVRHNPQDAEVSRALAHLRNDVASPPLATPADPAATGYRALEQELRRARQQDGVLGAVVLDHQGYVLAGEMPVAGTDRAAELAAALRGATDDADRTVRHLGLGEWRAIFLETEATRVRLMPLPDAMIAVAAAREVPAGWLIRLAVRLHGIAARLLGGQGSEPPRG